MWRLLRLRWWKRWKRLFWRYTPAFCHVQKYHLLNWSLAVNNNSPSFLVTNALYCNSSCILRSNFIRAFNPVAAIDFFLSSPCLARQPSFSLLRITRLLLAHGHRPMSESFITRFVSIVLLIILIHSYLICTCRFYGATPCCIAWSWRFKFCPPVYACFVTKAQIFCQYFDTF